MRLALPCFWWLAAASVAAAQHPKLSHELSALEADGPVDVIVQYKTTPTEANHLRMIAKGATHQRNLGVIKGAVYRISGRAAAQLADDPDVVYVAPDRT